jgi:hypothetical protein
MHKMNERGICTSFSHKPNAKSLGPQAQYGGSQSHHMPVKEEVRDKCTRPIFRNGSLYKGCPDINRKTKQSKNQSIPRRVALGQEEEPTVPITSCSEWAACERHLGAFGIRRDCLGGIKNLRGPVRHSHSGRRLARLLDKSCMIRLHTHGKDSLVFRSGEPAQSIPGSRALFSRHSLRRVERLDGASFCYHVDVKQWAVRDLTRAVCANVKRLLKKVLIPSRDKVTVKTISFTQ